MKLNDQICDVFRTICYNTNDKLFEERMHVKNDRKKRERTKTVDFVIDAYKTLLEQRRKTSLNPIHFIIMDYVAHF